MSSHAQHVIKMWLRISGISERKTSDSLELQAQYVQFTILLNIKTLVWTSYWTNDLNKHRESSRPLLPQNKPGNEFPTWISVPWPSAAPESDCAGGGELRSTEYLLIQLSCPVTGRINQSPCRGSAWKRIPGTSPHFRGEDGSVSQAKFDQQMQFPCATAIWDEDDTMRTRAKWWRQHGERERRTPGGSSLVHLLKGAEPLYSEEGVKPYVY